MGIGTVGRPARAVFLDRDGVLNEAVVRDGLPFSPGSVTELRIPPTVPALVARLRAAGFLTIGVTNQPDVARGRQTREAADAVNHAVLTATSIDAILVCYHDQAVACDCRKPAPGLLRSAASRYDIDLSQSIMVGDRWRDVEAGRRAACRTVFIDYDYRETKPMPPADVTVRSLEEGVVWILEQSRERPRPDRTLTRPLNQWPLELADEPVCEMLHDDQPGLPASGVVIENPPPEQRHEHGGAKPHPGEVDPGEWGKEIGERRLWSRERDFGPDRAIGNRLERSIGSDRLLIVPDRDNLFVNRLLARDARTPAAANPIVLRLGNKPGRGVHDLEPRLILVATIPRETPRKLSRGFTGSNWMADGGLRGRDRRHSHKCEDERQRTQRDHLDRP